MYLRLICHLWVAMILVFCSSSVLHAWYMPSSETAKVPCGMLPDKVLKLMAWPTAEQQTKKPVNIKSDVSKESLRAKNSSVEWIQKVIDPEWLPDEAEKTLGSKMFLLKDVHDGLDASYVEWEKNDYRFRVSQTMTVFYFDVTPTKNKIAEGDATVLQNASRKIASEIINDVAEVKLTDGTEIAKGGTKSILMNSSFDKAKIKPFDNGIIGLPAKWDLKNKLNRARFGFWWSRLCWWTNGQTLGFFTLKTEGGSWEPSYDTKLDETWF